MQYQWLRDGQPISGQTGATYQLTREDAGHNISVKASYKDNAGHDEAPLSEATAAVADVPAPNPQPNQAGQLTLSGEARVGSTLTAHLADGDGFDPAQVSYQWLRDGQPMSGQTGATYQLTSDDTGRSITVRASYTDYTTHSESPSGTTAGFISHIPVAKTPLVFDVTDARFGANGHDGESAAADDTAAIQAAIDAAWHAGGGTVRIPGGTYMIRADATTGQWQLPAGLKMRSNVTVDMAADTVLKAYANDKPYHDIFNFYEVENAHIRGGTLIGDRYTHQGTTGEWGNGITILSSRNISVEGTTIKHFWGDGIGIDNTYADPRLRNDDIAIQGITADGNRRQGISIMDGDHIRIQHSTLQNTGSSSSSAADLAANPRLKGTPPQAGIDIEPEAGQHVNHVDIRHNTFADNGGMGLAVLGFRPEENRTIDNIHIEDNTFTHNQGGIALRGVSNAHVTGNHITDDRAPPEYNLTIGERTPDAVVENNTLDKGRISDLMHGNNDVEARNHVPYTGYRANQPTSVTIHGAAKAGATLTAEVHDDNGYHENAVYYHWYADGVEIPHSAGRHYEGKHQYTPSDADIGKTLTVRVTLTDYGTHSGHATSAATAAIAAADHPTPNHSGSVTLRIRHDGAPGFDVNHPEQWPTLAEAADGIGGSKRISPEIGRTLYADVKDADGIPLGSAGHNEKHYDGKPLIHYQWLADGEPIPGAVHDRYVPLSNETGKHISVRVTYTDSAHHAESITSDASDALIDTIPPNHTGSVSIRGSDTLTATVHDADGLPDNIHYQWYKDGIAIPGATGSRYTKNPGDQDHIHTVKADYTDRAGYHETHIGTANTPAADTAADQYARDNLPPGAAYQIVADLGAAKTAIAADPTLQNLIISDGNHHALLQKNSTGYSDGMPPGWTLTCKNHIPAVAFHDGGADLASALNAAAQAAKTLQLGIELPAQREYQLGSQIVLENGVPYLHGNRSTLAVQNSVNEAALKLPNGASQGEISGLTLNMNAAPGVHGILGYDLHDYRIHDNHILHLGQRPGHPGYGITVYSGSGHTENITVENNHISAKPSNGAPAHADAPVGIAFNGAQQPGNPQWRDAKAPVWRQYVEDGTVAEADPSRTIKHITVRGNQVSGTYYGVAFSTVSDSEISGNHLHDNTRNISLQDRSNHNTVRDNILTDAHSSAIHIAYASSDNHIENNHIMTTRAGGQAILQAYQGSKNNHYHNNHIDVAHDATTNFMYTATDSSGTTYRDNIASGRVSRASIGAESIWDKAGAGDEKSAYGNNMQDPNLYDGDITHGGGHGALTGLTISGNILAPEPTFAGAPITYLGADSSHGLHGDKTLHGDLDATLNDNTWLGADGREAVRQHQSGDSHVHLHGNGITHADGTTYHHGTTAYSIGDYTLANDETTLYLLGTHATSGSGNAADNTLYGNAQTNRLEGGAGNDHLDGGYGADTLTGGAGADTFTFASLLDGKNIDTITDFNADEGDKIALNQAIFGRLGDNWYAAAGQHITHTTRVYQQGDTLYHDPDGSGSAYSATAFAKVNTVLEEGHFSLI